MFDYKLKLVAVMTASHPADVGEVRKPRSPFKFSTGGETAAHFSELTAHRPRRSHHHARTPIFPPCNSSAGPDAHRFIPVRGVVSSSPTRRPSGKLREPWAVDDRGSDRG